MVARTPLRNAESAPAALALVGSPGPGWKGLGSHPLQQPVMMGNPEGS